MLIEPLDVPRCVDLIGGGYDGTLVPDAQPERNAVVRHRIRSAIRAPAHFAIAPNVRNELLQILACIHSPDDQLHAVAGEPNGNVAVPPAAHHQARSGGNLEHALSRGSRNGSKAEVLPETRACLDVIDTIDQTFDSQYGQDVNPLRKLSACFELHATAKPNVSAIQSPM